jgi:hypothetical protein
MHHKRDISGLMGRSLLFKSRAKVNLNEIAQKLTKPINEHIRYFNLMAPRVFRKAIASTLANDPDLANFGEKLDKLKVDNRKLGKAKAGSGMSIKIVGRKLETRMTLFDSKMLKELGRDGFWKLKTLTEGRYTISLKAGIRQPYRVSASNPKSVGKYDEGKSRRKYDNRVDGDPSKTNVAFNFSKVTKKVTRSTRRVAWIEASESLAVNRLTEMINKRK